MAGYSRTPLVRKLGVRPGSRVCLAHSPREVRAELRSTLSACQEIRLGSGPLDFVILFAKSHDVLGGELALAAPCLSPAGVAWLSWPKQSSGVPTDLGEHVVREMGLRAGLVDVKVCAVTEVWSALKFVRRRADRRPG
ncbi:MAG: DUF3052 domain-containing protein [Thermoplasmata archaeon]|nr:DUF3052 domain-containing protein [Thermoplasmata archaeon]